MDRKIDNVVAHIRDLERRLNEADNNLRYIKVVQSLKYSLDKLYGLLLRDTALQREYQSTYINYFYGGSLSFYNLICYYIKIGDAPESTSPYIDTYSYLTCEPSIRSSR